MTHPERVYLIRHGQTDWNTNGRWQGTLPTGLNDVGHEQSRKLAAYLAHQPIEAVYTSDLPRAYDTAKALADILGVEPIVDVRWREFHVGIFQGLTRAEIITQHPEIFAAYENDGLNYIIPEGESRLQLQERAYAAWNDMLSNTKAKQVAVVSHGGTIKLLLKRLFVEDAEKLEQQPLHNTSLTILQSEADGTWKIFALATIPHLEEAIKEEAKNEGKPQQYF